MWHATHDRNGQALELVRAGTTQQSTQPGENGQMEPGVLSTTTSVKERRALRPKKSIVGVAAIGDSLYFSMLDPRYLLVLLRGAIPK